MTASLVELLLDTSDLGRALTSDFVDFYVIDRDEMFKKNVLVPTKALLFGLSYQTNNIR